MFKEFLKALLALNSVKKFVGVIEDDRTEEEQAKDWDAEEIASGETLKPKFRKVSKGKWKKYTVRNQNGSGSCVAQALAKGFEVLYKLETGKTEVFSSTPIYKQRRTFPGGGMYMHNAFKIAVRDGTCLEKDCKSQEMTDRQMDSQKLPPNFEDLNDMLDAVAYVKMPKDFDYFAAWVEKYGYASLHIATELSKWSRDFPALGSRNRNIRHAVAAVDAVNYKGVDYIVIEDSWGAFGDFHGQRLISREVFYDMFTRGAAFTVLKYDVVKKPKKFEKFEKWMEIGQRSAEISRFQDYLKTRGYFPKNVESTGYYGPITSLAVYNFQIATKAASPIVLNRFKGKYAHAGTLRQVNADL